MVDQTQIDLAGVKVEMKYLKDKVDWLDEKFDKFVEAADSKYANKTVEKIVYGMITIIVVGVLWMILSNIWLS